MRDDSVSRVLLEWYDENHRTMPWRVAPAMGVKGTRPDPYRVWLSEIMLQQTTVTTVRGYFEEFTRRWPTVNDLAAAPADDVLAAWAGLGYYARARNLIKCARIVSREMNGRFPDTLSELLRLPGIGPYTAAAISAIAFDKPETVVDGNVERVIARLHAVTRELPAAKPELTAFAARHTPGKRPGDYAQAIMDLGATICKPKSPLCSDCPLADQCNGLAKGLHLDLPRKTAKKEKPTRYGIAYVTRRADGHWLLERRRDTGLLGGMLGWPGSGWDLQVPEPPPIIADWSEVNSEVKHTFTHFHLVLNVKVATAPEDASATRGRFLDPQAFDPGDLPTVMRKVYIAALKVLKSHEQLPQNDF